MHKTRDSPQLQIAGKAWKQLQCFSTDIKTGGISRKPGITRFFCFRQPG